LPYSVLRDCVSFIEPFNYTIRIGGVSDVRVGASGVIELNCGLNIGCQICLNYLNS